MKQWTFHRDYPVLRAYRAGKTTHRVLGEWCLVSCDHLPRRSWPLFRARAMLGDLIAGFSSAGIQPQQEQSAA